MDRTSRSSTRKVKVYVTLYHTVQSTCLMIHPSRSSPPQPSAECNSTGRPCPGRLTSTLPQSNLFPVENNVETRIGIQKRAGNHFSLVKGFSHQPGHWVRKLTRAAFLGPAIRDQTEMRKQAGFLTGRPCKSVEEKVTKRATPPFRRLISDNGFRVRNEVIGRGFPEWESVRDEDDPDISKLY